MIAIRPTEAAVHEPLLPELAHWREQQEIAIGDLGKLAEMPWSKLRQLQIFPGCPLDSEVFEIPEGWTAAGRGRFPCARLIDPAKAGVPPDPLLAASRDERVRRALFALWLLGGSRGKGAPGTWHGKSSDFLRFAELQLANRPFEDGSVFGSLGMPDILCNLFPLLGATDKTKRRYGAVLGLLMDAGKRRMILDYPKLSRSAPAKDFSLEPVRKGAAVLKPRKPVPPRSFEPFSDEFVTHFLRRALWIQQNLADGIIKHIRRDQIIREKLVDVGYVPDSPAIRRARNAALASRKWRDASGYQLTRLPFEIRQVSLDGKEVMSDAWPPTDMKSFAMAVGIVQGCNLGVVNACTGARTSEILAADDGPFVAIGDRYHSLTFKLADKVGGEPRDWPIHSSAVRAIEIQQRLSALIRPKGQSQLWVVLRGRRGARLAQASGVFDQTVVNLGLGHLRGSRSAHLHRWRHTVARLAALSMVGAPKVVFDLFGHKNLEMTLRYMLSDPGIAEQAMRVAKETTYAMVADAVLETVSGESGGPAAESLRQHLPKAMRKGEEQMDAKSLREAAEVLTWQGRYWSLVRPGVICTKGLGQFGPCTRGRGMPDPGACRTSCDHRLELGIAKQQCSDTLKALIEEREAALADEMLMLVENLDGQIIAELKRWDDVRGKVLTEHPEIRAVWKGTTR